MPAIVPRRRGRRSAVRAERGLVAQRRGRTRSDAGRAAARSPGSRTRTARSPRRRRRASCAVASPRSAPSIATAAAAATAASAADVVDVHRRDLAHRHRRGQSDDPTVEIVADLDKSRPARRRRPRPAGARRPGRRRAAAATPAPPRAVAAYSSSSTSSSTYHSRNAGVTAKRGQRRRSELTGIDAGRAASSSTRQVHPHAGARPDSAVGSVRRAGVRAASWLRSCSAAVRMPVSQHLGAPARVHQVHVR